MMFCLCLVTSGGKHRSWGALGGRMYLIPPTPSEALRQRCPEQVILPAVVVPIPHGALTLVSWGLLPCPCLTLGLKEGVELWPRQRPFFLLNMSIG